MPFSIVKFALGEAEEAAKKHSGADQPNAANEIYDNTSYGSKGKHAVAFSRSFFASSLYFIFSFLLRRLD